MPPLQPSMHPGKKYLYSFLSLLCVVGWFALLVFIITKEESDRWILKIQIVQAIMLAAGIVGGSILILVSAIRIKRLKYSFIYNLCGTLNIMVGSIGLFWCAARDERPSYLIAGSFAVGLYIYHDIYFRKPI